MGLPGKLALAGVVVLGLVAVGGEAGADPDVPATLRSSAQRDGRPERPTTGRSPDAESERSSLAEEALDEREASATSERTAGMMLSLLGAVPLTYGVVELWRTSDETGDFAGLGRITPFVAATGGALLAAIFVPIWIHGQYRVTAVRDERRKLRAHGSAARTFVPTFSTVGSGGGAFVLIGSF